MRKIAVFTGSRTEYGILRPVIKRIHQSSNLALQLVIGAVHFQKKFGSTFTYIEEDRFPIAARVRISLAREIPGKMALEVGDGIGKLAKVFLDLKPDVVLLNGDRSESFAAAVACALLPMPLAHTHGGDITRGGIDESMRHAITKLAHIHFAANKEGQKRILMMGENPKHVFLVGAPGLDEIVAIPKINREVLEKKLKLIIIDPLIVVLMHPITTSVSTAGADMHKTLKAVSKFNGVKILIYPNGDPGSDAIIAEIEKYRNTRGFFIFKSIERKYYINLLRQAAVLVGNSSGGIIETATVHLPTVNIGLRQFSRERNLNIIDVDNDIDQIKKAIEKCLYDDRFKKRVARCKNLYGSGKASEKIVSILEAVELSDDLLQKQFHTNYVAKN